MSGRDMESFQLSPTAMPEKVQEADYFPDGLSS
jgi:hypothetical protein